MQAYIELQDGKIYADIPYAGGQGPEWAKRVPGARAKYKKLRDGRKGPFEAWVYPLDMATCYSFRRIFGKQLRIGKALAAWARVEIERREKMMELRTASDAELQRVSLPRMLEALDRRKYQRVAARFIADTGGNVLLADDPGLGKTIEVMAGLIELGDVRRVLVFAPRTAVSTTWPSEIAQWMGDDGIVYPCVGPRADREKLLSQFLADADPQQTKTYRYQFVVCNVEMVRVKRVTSCPAGLCDGADLDCAEKRQHKSVYFEEYPELFQMEWDAIIIDESHRALIGRHIMSKSITQTRLGMMRLRQPATGRRIAMSGTPGRGQTVNLWGTLNWLRPDLFSSFWRWVETYYDVADDGYGKKIGALRPEQEAEFDAMLAPHMLRRTKAEVAPDLPPKQYGGTRLEPDNPASPVGIWLRMDDRQADLYRQMESKSMAAIDGGDLDAIGVLPELTRLRQFSICAWRQRRDGDKIEPIPTQSGHYEWLLQFCKERAEVGRKVVVASQFTEVINAFALQLQKDGIPNYVLTGQTSDKRRKQIWEAFQSEDDNTTAFLLNTFAGGVSLTLDAADDLVFLDETFIPDDQEQVEDRIHRISRIHQVTIWYLRSAGTITEAICQTTSDREVTLKERLDGPRGIQFMRRLLAEAE